MTSDDMVFDQQESSEETAVENPSIGAPVETALSVEDNLGEGETPEVSPAEGEDPEIALPEAALEEELEETLDIIEEPAGLSDEEMFLAAFETDSPDDVAELDGIMLQPLKRGQIVEGTIVRIMPAEIMIDVGAKSEGIVTGREMETLPRDFLDSLEVGQEILVYIRNPEDRSGNVLLSLTRAMEEHDWRDAERYLKSREVYQGRITGFNKGGLIVRFGRLRGFLPASQVSAERRRRGSGATPEDRWGDMIGEEVAVKVIEVERARNRLILSERAAEREMRSIRRKELLTSLEVGQIRKGWVISLADFGAFVDLGGADGLVHLSELSWKHVSHPREALKVGDEVDVEVISVDRESQRIALSIKRLLPDPWNELAAKYEVGQLVQGTVTKLTKFGAFARLVADPEIEGLIHVSEMAEHRVGHPREIVEEGDIVTLRIVRIDSERRRVGLSMKRVDSEEYIEVDWRSALSEANEEETESVINVETEPESDEPTAELEAVEEVAAEANVDAEAEADIEIESEDVSLEELALDDEMDEEREDVSSEELALDDEMDEESEDVSSEEPALDDEMDEESEDVSSEEPALDDEMDEESEDVSSEEPALDDEMDEETEVEDKVAAGEDEKEDEEV